MDVVDCVPFERKHLAGSCMSAMPGIGNNAWILENPRPIAPFRVKASASFFYIDHAIEPATVATIEDHKRVYGKYGFAFKGMNPSAENVIANLSKDRLNSVDGVQSAALMVSFLPVLRSIHLRLCFSR